MKYVVRAWIEFRWLRTRFGGRLGHLPLSSVCAFLFSIFAAAFSIISCNGGTWYTVRATGWSWREGGLLIYGPSRSLGRPFRCNWLEWMASGPQHAELMTSIVCQKGLLLLLVSIVARPGDEASYKHFLPYFHLFLLY